ncbi:MAG: VWA domain-containing protein, partial [Treponema sp.]|nr:VWA domain-containing protein [Treponema sp.]
MFTDFFYLLRKEGVPVTVVEWMTLVEAMHLGLADSSLSRFYNMARSILVKSETHFDQYDVAFQRYFDGLEDAADLYEQVHKWIANPNPPRFFTKEERSDLLALLGEPNLEKMRAALERRLKNQKKEHHRGSRMIGTGGTSGFGNSGFQKDPKLASVRIGSESYGRVAVKVSANRNFIGYRADETIGIRQFELALRRLRQFSSRIDAPKDELDLDETINATCKNAGALKIVFDRPRKNTVKLLVLMDEGGSMSVYAKLCSRLFSAVHKSTHFKDIRFYYFHNCIYDYLYDDTSDYQRKAISTTDILNQFSSDYKVILVGDASMAPSELLLRRGIISWNDPQNEEPGLDWL